MKRIKVCDLTLREGSKDLSFREKLEVTKLLDNTGADVIETGEFSSSRTEVLFLHSVCGIVKNAAVCCTLRPEPGSAKAAFDAIKAAAKPRLRVAVPVSTVQMEYILRKKPAAVSELIGKLVAEARELCPDVEFSALDATRADREFLKIALKSACEAGAAAICVCDSAGTMLPSEVGEFIEDVKSAVDGEKVALAAEFSNASGLGGACAVSAIEAGVTMIKAAVGIAGVPSLEAAAAVFRARGDAIGCQTGLNHTLLGHSCEQIASMLHPAARSSAPAGSAGSREEFTLNREDDIKTVSDAVAKLGYELSGDDMAKVFEDFSRLSQKKPIGPRELEAIVAGCAMQGAPVYKLKSFVITTGNLFSPSAQVCLEKDGRELHGISMGDGPIDASFMAIESIVGHHFELDDFQIRSVTEGREAMGEAIVKLRKGGKLYPGKGLSTDIIGSSIHAFLNALNKICGEEAQV
ncbi:MAG: hypothetical protein IJV00_07980 [Clostridia bacterium]|nr:hypothetical protein [Clostridia bacterium]